VAEFQALACSAGDQYQWPTSVACLGRYLVSVRLGIDFGGSLVTAVFTCTDGRRGLVPAGELPPVDGRDGASVQMVNDFLRRVASGAVELSGEAVNEAVLVCPAGWDAVRGRVLLSAAAAAGLARATVVARAVVAAEYFVDVLDNDMPDGSALVVCDTAPDRVEVSVVRWTGDGFAVAATDRLGDPGGDDALEQRAQPMLECAGDALRAATSGAPAAAVLLVGAMRRDPVASAVPAVWAAVLARVFGVAPIVVDASELMFAAGGLHQPPSSLVQTAVPIAVRAGAAAPAAGATVSPPVPGRRRVPVAVVGAVLVLALVAGAFVAWRSTHEHRTGPGNAAHPVGDLANPGNPANPGSPGGGGSPRASGAAAAIGPPVCGKSIGFMGALSGPQAPLGVPIRDGVQLAVNEYNARHPSCTATLIALDTQGDAVRVPAAVDHLPSDLLGLIGPILTGETEAAGPRLDKAGLPFLTLSSTDSLDGRGWSTFHRAVGSNTRAGEASMRYLAQHLAANKVYVVAQADEYGQTLLAAARHSGEVQVVGATTLNARTDYRRLATTIRGSGADSVFVASYTKEALKLLQPLRAAGFDGTVIAGDGALTRQFGAQAPNSAGATYVVSACRYPDEQTTAGSRFAAAYTQAYNTDMSEYSGFAYDAAGMLLAGLARGAGTRAMMAQHLASIRYTGVVGDYQFTDRGEPVAPRFGVWRVAGGDLTFADIS
jgi:branched-chain amino acid transport system substrate-binding protein